MPAFKTMVECGITGVEKVAKQAKSQGYETESSTPPHVS